TYADIDTSQDYLWNFLFFTGYHKKRKQYQENGEIYMELAIPNMEVRHIYKHTVLLWFEEKIKMKDLSELYRSILDSDRKKLSEFLSEFPVGSSASTKSGLLISARQIATLCFSPPESSYG